MNVTVDPFDGHSLTGHLDECVLFDGTQTATIQDTLPFAADGFHWKTATTQVTTAVSFAEGATARGIIDGTVRYCGGVADVAVHPAEDVAIIQVVPRHTAVTDNITPTAETT